MRRSITALLAVGIAILCSPARAQIKVPDWPIKPVRIVSPFAPGGSSDTLARLLAEQLSQKFGVQFFVENKGGAGGLIGTVAVAGAEPDGYTLMISSIGTHVTAPLTKGKVGYDPVTSFTHIAYIGGPPIVIAVDD